MLRGAAGEAQPQEFWIDVGGTFTDCIARPPNGQLRTHKLLSSGVYRGRVGAGSTSTQIIDSGRNCDPPEFFRGFRFRLTDSRASDDIEISEFDPRRGALLLDQPLSAPPAPGAVYELHSNAPAPVVGVHWLNRTPLDEPLGDVRVRLGTTRGTNTLLERRGAPTALLTTAGFGDLLPIGDQTRPKLFDLNIRKAAPLARMTIELEERVDASGIVRKALDESHARRQLDEARASGITALAICLLNSHRNPEHELLVEELARPLGFEEITISSRLSPLEGVLSRAETTLINAYLGPVMRGYLETLRKWMPRASLLFMTSAGGLAEAEAFAAKDGILSGPAGGVVGCAATARLDGLPNVIGFDMGGTSTDVSRYDGQLQRRYEMELEGDGGGGRLRIRGTMLQIETVAAGGGSVCGFDGIKPYVGPVSAGAHPGPACYGHGGPLCVTDVNFYLGRILQDNFPFPLDSTAVRSRLDELRSEIEQSTGRQYTREELASGLVDIANEHMAAAIRRISTLQGYDPREYALLSFGGAGGQHACSVAQALGMSKVLLPARAGTLSAYGIGMAAVERHTSCSVGAPLDHASLDSIEQWRTTQETGLRKDLLRAGNPEDSVRPGILTLELRYQGQNATIPISQPPNHDWRGAFEAGHHQLYGFTFPERQVEINAAQLEVATRPRNVDSLSSSSTERTDNDRAILSQTKVYIEDKYVETPALRRDHLVAGSRIDGPAIVLDATSTFLIEPAWQGEMLESGDILLTLRELTDTLGQREIVDRIPTAGQEAQQASYDPITLELFNHRFAGIAEQMGQVLERTALSTNVKERLDFSCALFDSDGGLVANAPHIPVHLGSMGECVRCLLEDVAGLTDRPTLRPGDVFITNDPYRGGTHLPDVTVITPVFDQAGERVIFFTASRAHHAEIGGIAPGSMPPESRTLAQEGVLIRTMRLVEEPLRRLLEEAPYPSRDVATNLADVYAQAAANRCGERLLNELVAQHGLETVQAYMSHIRSAAEQKMRRTLGKLEPGEHTFTDHLDDGTPIAVRITIAEDSATIDFTGSGGVHPGNLNATTSIVQSAVLYCFRCLIAEEIPLNDGVLAPLRIVVPEGILNPPAQEDPGRCAAVAGGNVETSQRVVDVIFGALGVVAASQGTMNNLSFGNDRFGYYETICGGAGAGPHFYGADAVHTHMTNTRLTDPEVFEARYPVRLRRFAIRRESGGAGRRHGGDGIIREIEFLEPLEVSLLTQSRVRAPYGLDGGSDGMPGTNLLTRAGSATAEQLPGIAQFSARPGDVLLIETPGGGGFGRLES